MNDATATTNEETQMISQYAQTNRSVNSFRRTVDGFRVIVTRETWGDRPGQPSRFQALVQPKGDERLFFGDIRGSICETDAQAVASAFAKLAEAQVWRDSLGAV